MTDKNGQEVSLGARCRFYAEGREKWVSGTVRALSTKPPFQGHARVDDGDPNNDDLHTNGFRVSSWAPPEHIEVLP